MFTGHFAAALVIKPQVPETPSWALFAGTAVLDFLWAPFTLLGWEIWEKGNIQIPWTHSLVMALVWSMAYALLFMRRGRTIMLALGAAVFSHFVLDYLVHEPHLTLFPGSTVRFGLGLGQAPWGPGWLLELAVILAASGYYIYRSRNDDRYGRNPIALCSTLVGLHVLRGVLGM